MEINGHQLLPDSLKSKSVRVCSLSTLLKLSVSRSHYLLHPPFGFLKLKLAHKTLAKDDHHTLFITLTYVPSLTHLLPGYVNTTKHFLHVAIPERG